MPVAAAGSFHEPAGARSGAVYCRDDREFVRQIWVTVFERAPNAIEERVLLSLLRKGGSRLSLIERVVRMTEFRQVVSRPVV